MFRLSRVSPSPPAHAQTSFALTRQADPWSAESGERGGARGTHGVTFFRECGVVPTMETHAMHPPHPNPLPRGERGSSGK
ncbi:hypothetical protein FZ942_30230 [Azospirillum lipoferum]|uniref:Uncharacterized protein n=1 Tax=Azospirillum lipoferum TaxID=193 RepID=A0A5A9GBR4_AZOLI|nr:hypothetical protein FZ942_30230 [Azospirillum lipoferum]